MVSSLNNTVIAPIGTAIWLIDNTSLTFKQIGDFCDFTEAEIQLIADGLIGKGILPVNPIKNGNLLKEEIEAREKDGKALNNAFKALEGFDIKIQKKRKYIPMLQRRSRPNAIFWLINYFPDLSDLQIVKLVRTTKSMVQSIRNKEYSEYANLVAKDPVVLGFCSQRDINKAVENIHKKAEKVNKKKKTKTTSKTKKIKPKKTKKIKQNKAKNSKKNVKINDKKNKKKR